MAARKKQTPPTEENIQSKAPSTEERTDGILADNASAEEAVTAAEANDSHSSECECPAVEDEAPEADNDQPTTEDGTKTEDGTQTESEPPATEDGAEPEGEPSEQAVDTESTVTENTEQATEGDGITDSEPSEELYEEDDLAVSDTSEAEAEPEHKTAPLPHHHTEESGREKEHAEKSDEKRRGIVDTVFDFIELFVFTLVGVLIITSFFIRQSVVEGDSMLGTLRDGDNLLISDFMYDPTPGDIIVCEDYSTALRKPIVKRVIAIEGQTIRFTADAVYVDGTRLDEPYVFTDFPGYKYDVSTPPAVFRIGEEKYQLKFVEYQYFEITVPEGELFVMGDHRNNSTDSRVIGTVTEDSVIGKVLIRFYPFEDFGTVK